MTELIKRHHVVGLVPFYADPELTPDEFAGLAASALRSVAYLGFRHPVVLVDDGNTLRGSVNLKDVVATVKLEPRGGKAEAVRFGILEALVANPDAEYLIQSDFDGDPNPRQAELMVRLLRKNGITGDQSAMVLGERDEALKRKGYLDPHRTAIFALQQTFCVGLGYPDITDPTTGLRTYTRSLAEKFISFGTARGFGSDVEQLVLARLANAPVLSLKLKDARKRADHTLLVKFKDCQDALLLHRKELVEAGLGKLVDIFGDDAFIVNTLQEFRLHNSDGLIRGSSV